MTQCSDPIAKHMEQFAQFLRGEGYASQTIKWKCALAAEFSAWIRHCGLSMRRLDENHLQQFNAHRRRGKRLVDRRSCSQLLHFLRIVGVTRPMQPKVDHSPLARVTREYESFLRGERGLSRATVARYLPIVRQFLEEHFANNDRRIHDGLRDLVPRDLHSFILRDAQRATRTHAKAAVSALRSFLRFLQQRGITQVDLAAALPGMAHWRLSHIPKSLSPEDVERLIQSCDRDTRSGQRDHAIVLLLARLGLRGGEVLAMTLDDLDWRKGEVLVRGKGQRFERLPLPRDVGAAIVHYLRHVRPRCATRNVFIRLKAPWQPLGQSAICSVVRRALERSGLDPAFKGAHLFRHSLATNMIRGGASLGEIGQILRHSSPATTQIYAKVDVEGLRDIAMPWMGGA